jgi:hypothetical protein
MFLARFRTIAVLVSAPVATGYGYQNSPTGPVSAVGAATAGRARPWTNAELEAVVTPGGGGQRL